MNAFLLRAAWALFAVAGVLPAQAQNQCGSLQTHYGPFDFRVHRDKLPVVENRHFTPEIASLIRGVTATTPGPDIEYTLRAFPNHVPALASLMRWARMKQTDHPKDLKYSVDCHFDRALRWRLDDVVVRMLFAQWLGETGRKERALQQLAQVEPQNNPQTIYNLGLLYMQFGEIDKALQHAQEAMRLGFDTTLLEEQLRAIGKWRDPENEPAGDALVTPGGG